MIVFLYKKILKPILFLFPADDVHLFFLKMGNFSGHFSFLRWKLKLIFLFKNKSLNQKISGLDFENPLGLAAGFDYDADLIQALPCLGFGYHTIGTITNLSYAGNPPPMLGRLPKSKSLLVNKGFKNVGVDSILKKVAQKKKKIPLGISLGSTNKSYCDIDEMAGDIYSSFEKVLKENYFDYFELNISCPNLINTGNISNKFDTKEGLDLLLSRLKKLPINKPLFIKMYLEKNEEDTLSLVETAVPYDFVSGFIFSNLVKDRTNPAFNKEEIEKAGQGNFSGKPTEKITNALISVVYQKYHKRFTIIGCGGVFSGKDAYDKIKRGASLVQLITGMVYEGPAVIKKINKELVELVKKDGFKNISQVIGAYYHK